METLIPLILMEPFEQQMNCSQSKIFAKRIFYPSGFDCNGYRAFLVELFEKNSMEFSTLSYADMVRIVKKKINNNLIRCNCKFKMVYGICALLNEISEYIIIIRVPS